MDIQHSQYGGHGGQHEAQPGAFKPVGLRTGLFLARMKTGLIVIQTRMYHPVQCSAVNKQTSSTLSVYVGR